jgi:type VI secretion system protein VasD
VLSASSRVNPSPDGEGRPVQVRAYQLVSDSRLRNATFEDIWQKDRDTLQNDLLSVEQYPLFPGETKSVVVKPAAQGHFLAFMALFREPQGKDWFVSFELPEHASAAACPKGPARLPVWLDRMQIQDGQGRALSEEPGGPTTDGSGEK